MLSCASCGVRTPLTDDLVLPVPDADAYVPPLDAALAGASLEDAADAGPADAPPDVALPAADLGNVTVTSGAYVNGAEQTFSAGAAFYASVAGTPALPSGAQASSSVEAW